MKPDYRKFVIAMSIKNVGIKLYNRSLPDECKQNKTSCLVFCLDLEMLQCFDEISEIEIFSNQMTFI